MTERTLLSLTGTDRNDFLQSLATNDIANGDIVYTALLTPQGKYLADFFVIPQADRLLIDVDSDLAVGLAQRLSMYRLRADVQIETLPWSVTCGTGDAPDGALPDPRHAELGWRLYTEAEAPEANPVDWTALRVAHGIPQSGVELKEDTFILEAGFERLNGVDFRKGCFVGQEIVARMKHKTTLRKGLAQVAVTGDATPGPILTEDGREAGALTTVAGGLGLAHLRFDRAAGPMTRGTAQITMVRNFLKDP
jgi:folate-binding protein YgfZ